MLKVIRELEKNRLAIEESQMLLRILFDNSNNERNDMANLKNLPQSEENIN